MITVTTISNENNELTMLQLQSLLPKTTDLKNVLLLVCNITVA